MLSLISTQIVLTPISVVILIGKEPPFLVV